MTPFSGPEFCDLRLHSCSGPLRSKNTRRFALGLLNPLGRGKNQQSQIWAARLQNEIAPETFLIWYEKWFEKREKRSKKRSETRHFQPLSDRLKLVHLHFSKSFSPPKICQNKTFFQCRGGHANASTPDPDTFEKYRDTPPISIMIVLQKYALLLAESSLDTIRLPFVSRCFCRSIRVRGRWNTPKKEYTPPPAFFITYYIHI